MQTGTIISGAGHAALILWVVLGDWLFARKDAPPIAVAEVSLMTSAEFDAMVAAVPSTPDPVVTPAPAEEAAPETPAPETASAEESAPIVAPEPVVPEPVPSPDVTPPPEALPENNGVADAEPLPVNPDPIPEVPLPLTESPRPKPAPRVAPIPVDAPDPALETTEAPVEAVSPEPVAEPEVVQEEQTETAPEEAGTVLETEANREEQVTASGAPATSPRPKGRPARREATAEPVAEPVAAEEPQADDLADAIAGAVADAATETESAQSSNIPAGPPMTGGEKDALRVAVQQCWNVGSLSTDALRVTVVLGVSVSQDGVPDGGSIRMIDFSGGTEAAAGQAFEAARRAVIRCGARGFPLPPEKYDQWREMELVFNPDGMRLR